MHKSQHLEPLCEAVLHMGGCTQPVLLAIMSRGKEFRTKILGKKSGYVYTSNKRSNEANEHFH